MDSLENLVGKLYKIFPPVGDFFFFNSHRDNKEHVVPIFENFNYFFSFYLIVIFTIILYVQEKNYSIEYAVYYLIKNVIFH